MAGYVHVAPNEGDELVELPLEADSTLLLSTLRSTVPKACGLRFRNPDNGSLRGVKLSVERFYPPEDGWCGRVYVCVLSSDDKRKAEDYFATPAKRKSAVSDLIILGLAWKTTEDQVRRYFESFGDVAMVVVKTNAATGLSKGFGFVRFHDPVVQTRVISQRHYIDGRWCDVKIPNLPLPDRSQACKIFVGQLRADITAVELREYFSRFGEVTDIFIPQPFRMFAFVTFSRPTDARTVCEAKDHSINGIPVNVSEAVPASKKPKHSQCSVNASDHRFATFQNGPNQTPCFNILPQPVHGVPYFWRGVIPNNFMP